MSVDNAADQLAMQELAARLSLIETMIAEGRQKTESWGWTFVLWGAAYFAAIVLSNLGTPFAEWTTWGHHTLAWPITMMSTLVLMFLYITLVANKGEKQPETTIGRAIYSMWIAMGVSMMLFFIAAGISGRLDQHIYIAVIGAMLGMTNAASSMILKWRAQFLTALVWWSAAVAACFGSLLQSLVVFLVAIFFGQIVFGIYGMISESRQRQSRGRASGAAHA
jgi:MFS family permease